MPESYDLLANYLKDCYTTVKDYCDEHGGVENLDGDAVNALQSVNFTDGKAPDYRHKVIRDWYHIRYLYAYAYEYRQIYRRLLKDQEPPVMKILSIGCGDGIDYWAAWEARRMLMQETEKHIEYTGLDLADWDRKWGVGDLTLPDASNTSYFIGDAVRYLKQVPVLEQNIFVFPKSISEFPDEVFDRLCELFAGARFQFEERKGSLVNTPKVHFLVSYRSDGRSSKDGPPDMERTRSLAKKMEETGAFSLVPGWDKVYTWRDDCSEGGAPKGNSWAYIDRLDRGIGFDEVDRLFYSAPDVKEFLKKLTGKGKNADGSFDNPYDIKRVVRLADYISYQILTFVRKE